MESQAEKRRRVKKIVTALKKAHPDAKLALDYTNPLELLIALILAAQARDDVVNSVTQHVFPRYRDASAWAREKPERLHEQLKQVNFYRRKTSAIQKACQALLEDFEGRVPDQLEDLLTLPGVGRKTANIVLGNGFGEPAIGVDTHVARLSQRLELTDQTVPDKIEADLVQVVAKPSSVKFCHLLQYHGRRVCTAKNPNCEDCSIRKLCPYPDSGA